MKLSKKKLFAVSVVTIMIAILSMSSLAWFSDADSVTNNFGVAGGDDAEKIFSIDVMELVDTDGDGMYDATFGYDGQNPIVNGFTYENILPGDWLFKRPSTKNTSTLYDQWICMKVTFDNANDLVNTFVYKYKIHPLDMLYTVNGTDYNGPKTKLTQSANWVWAEDETAVDGVNDTITYVFYYNAKLEAGQSAVLFTWVNIPWQLRQQDMALVENGVLQMTVTGEAIQTKNIPADNAKDAFAIVRNDQTILP